LFSKEWKFRKICIYAVTKAFRAFGLGRGLERKTGNF
jgi:hypothetical protein